MFSPPRRSPGRSGGPALSPRPPRSDATRERLLQSATAQFAARGYLGTTVDEISAGAGVTKGAFYYWFRDKADIARDVRHVLFESLTVDALATIDIEGGVLPALRAGFARFIDALHDLGDARRFLAETWRMPADSDGPFDHAAGVDLLAGILRAGQATGELGEFDAHVMAVALVAALSKLSLETLDGMARDPAVHVVGRMLAALAPLPAEVR